VEALTLRFRFIEYNFTLLASSTDVQIRGIFLSSANWTALLVIFTTNCENSCDLFMPALLLVG
jgi:hypothetical protein